jgi:hypothetical protein
VQWRLLPIVRRGRRGAAAFFLQADNPERSSRCARCAGVRFIVNT